MIYMLLAVVLMAMDQSGNFVPRMRASIAYLIEPVYLVAELPARALRGLRTYTRSYATLADENRLQADRLLQQQAQMQRLAALEMENARLRALLEAGAGHSFDYHFAEMILVSMDPYAHQVIIDSGSRDGVVPGQAVIDGLGILGQVETVQLGQAQVRLISDPDHAIPVQIVRTGERTLAYGTGDAQRLELPSLPIQSDVRVDDLLVTSGLGDRFPPGFPVAMVTAVERDTGGAFARVDARPLALLDRGREVLLVVPAAPATPGSEGQP
jgi:rod shape-determining protein MreC